MKNITDQKLNLPSHAPVMVLPNALLFPNALLPLTIFEPRYRAMLELTLKDHRMFCIGLVRQGVSEWSSPADFHHIAGLGLIRACVGRPDGTSQLVLQGLARVEFTGFVAVKPFVVAEIRELPEVAAGREETAALMVTVLELFARHREHGQNIPKGLDQQLAQVEDPGVLADIIAHTLIQDPYCRQSLLEDADVTSRLHTLIRHLRAELQ